MFPIKFKGGLNLNLMVEMAGVEPASKMMPNEHLQV